MSAITEEIKCLLPAAQADALRIYYFETLPSTNQYLIDKVKPSDYPCVVITNHQTKGKGQRKNTWHSDKNSALTFSIGLFSPNNSLNPIWSLIFAIGACKVLNRHTTASVKIKWPNDLYIDGSKCAGILIESFASRTGHCVINGIGINLKVPEGQFRQPVSAFSTNASNSTLFAEIITETLNNWHTYQNGDFTLTEQFKNYDYLANKRIALTDNNSGQQRTGTAKGIDSNGFLLIEENGVLKALINQHHIHILEYDF